jgi:hypothetical protein
LERWLPHLLEITTLANESLDTYLVENPVHALHLQSNLGATTSVLYGDEQRRCSSLWHTTGIVDPYVPIRLPPINQHYYSKRVKVEQQDPVVKSEDSNVKEDSSSPLTAAQTPLPPQSLPASIGSTSTVDAPATPAAREAASVLSSSIPPPTKSESTIHAPICELPEERYQQLRRAENLILLQRRGLFLKRDKRKTTKKNKRRDATVKPTVIVNERVRLLLTQKPGKGKPTEPGTRWSCGCTTFASVVWTIGVHF